VDHLFGLPSFIAAFLFTLSSLELLALNITLADSA
jgi:hypothetical protein